MKFQPTQSTKVSKFTENGNWFGDWSNGGAHRFGRWIWDANPRRFTHMLRWSRASLRRGVHWMGEAGGIAARKSNESGRCSFRKVLWKRRGIWPDRQLNGADLNGPTFKNMTMKPNRKEKEDVGFKCGSILNPFTLHVIGSIWICFQWIQVWIILTLGLISGPWWLMDYLNCGPPTRPPWMRCSFLTVREKKKKFS